MAVIIGRDEGMVQPIEQRDVAIDLIKPAPVIMTNLLNLTHTTGFSRLSGYQSRSQTEFGAHRAGLLLRRIKGLGIFAP